ncbi:MAG: tRNA 5-methoxyuridine(34)/uridine 5-oxyacetic acid(34) synthase CmoB, partial [Campylobacterales bacterium]
MSIAQFRAEKEAALKLPANALLLEAINALPNHRDGFSNGEVPTFTGSINDEEAVAILKIAKMLMPWRKGPFKIGDLFIDSEWQSQIKYALLEPHLDLEGKKVADVGCNNGYYMIRMLAKNPAKIVGFDPSILFSLQFRFLMHYFYDERLTHEMLGFQHLREYGERFDTLLCLGVLYHHPNPLGMLDDLKSALVSGGQLFLDTFYIEGESETALFPKERYAKISNVYFIPTIAALRNWLTRSGFVDIKVLATKPTDTTEQRKTEWING